jgi:nitrile hydratase beta subunit
MGGMHGFGTVQPDDGLTPPLTGWEARVEVMTTILEAHGVYNIDEFRHGIEQMNPAHYLRATYFERWLATIEHNLVAKGYLAAGELDARVQQLRDQPSFKPSVPPLVSTPPLPMPLGTSPATPVFAAGDLVITRNINPRGHTRLPRYARGKRGVVYQVHGVQIFPDSGAHGRGPDPRPLYNVRFDANELWGDDAEGVQAVHLDLWEPYLERIDIAHHDERHS